MVKSKSKEIEYQLGRAYILHEAERIFASKGFHNATMATIADASGFAIGTLYYFFDSKENLYTTVVNEKLDRMYSGIRESVDREEGITDKIEKLVVSQFQFVESNVDFYGLLIQGEGSPLSDGGTILRDKLTADYLGYVGFVEEIIRLGIKTKSLKAMDPRMMAYALLGIIRSFAHNWMLTKQDTPLSNMVGSVLDIFLKGVKAEVGR